MRQEVPVVPSHVFFNKVLVQRMASQNFDSMWSKYRLYFCIYLRREKLRTNLITYLIPFTKIIKPKQQRHFQQTKKNNSKNEENQEKQTKTYQDHTLASLEAPEKEAAEIGSVHRWVSQPKKLHQFEIQPTERTSEVLISEKKCFIVHWWPGKGNNWSWGVATRVTVALFHFEASHWGY